MKIHVLVSITMIYCILSLEVIDLVGACSFLEKNVVIWLSNVQYSPVPNTALNLLYETFFGVYVFQCKPLSYYRIVSMIVDSVMQQLSSFCS